VKLAKALKPTWCHLQDVVAGTRIYESHLRAANMATTAHCKAHFTIISQGVVGWFKVTASIDRSTGGVRYRTAKPICRTPRPRAGRLLDELGELGNCIVSESRAASAA